MPSTRMIFPLCDASNVADVSDGMKKGEGYCEGRPVKEHDESSFRIQRELLEVTPSPSRRERRERKEYEQRMFLLSDG